jgi:hypothetical protein
MTIPINDNLFSGDCGLWYDVIKLENNKTIHCVCPYSECKSFDDAMDYYFKNFHGENSFPIVVEHYKISKKSLEALALAC